VELSEGAGEVMSDTKNANTRMILRALKLRLADVADRVAYFNKAGRLGAVESAACSVLSQMQSTCQINNFKVDAEEAEDGKIRCLVRLKPTRAAQFVTMTVSLEAMANGFFYAKLTDKTWHVCTEKDIYDPNYDPVVVEFGETERDWTVHTKETVLRNGVIFDDIRTWGYNHVLRSPCATCNMKSGHERIDNKVYSGIHCQSCWDEIVFESRKRSW
jgi:hypothetical protein